MQWRGRRGSRNVEDRRSMGGRAAGGVGIVGMLAVLAFGYFFGIDISPLVNAVDQQGGQGGAPRELTQREADYGQFASVVLADTEEVWHDVLPAQAGRAYADPRMVLYSQATSTACGTGQAAMGPFYCPSDRTLYLDTDFFDVMTQKMGAGGDFAFAYVIGHEVGHHVQNLLGILPRVNQMRIQASRSDSNAISVMTELQADCFAGIWARHAQERFGTLDEGDLREAQAAARAVGDDVLQANAGRRIVPDDFTHGSADQRQEWLTRGFRSGRLADCDPFSTGI